MNFKQLNEVLDFCEEQNLMNRSFDEVMSLYDSYCDYKFEQWMELESSNLDK